jgi:membrane-associated phospholipid phosphatase
MKCFALPLCCLVLLFSAVGAQTSGTQPTPTPTPTPSPTPWALSTPRPSSIKHFVPNIFRDQVAIWTAPFKPEHYNADWFVPLTLGAAGLLATDRITGDQVPTREDLQSVSHDISRLGEIYVTGGTAAAFYVTGQLTHNERARETGVLSMEALVNTGIVTEVLKVATGRVRPTGGDERSEFFDKGSSFPSGHSSSIWSIATVVAYEYHDKPLIAFGAYGLATVVSLSRFTGQNHYLSDIAIGSGIGFGIGRFVYRRYHDPNIDAPRIKTTTFLKPEVIPYYDSRHHSYGGSLVWTL